MPTRFTQTLDTVKPDVAVNQLQYDTSVGEMFQTVGDVVSGILEGAAEKRDAEIAGSFLQDMVAATEDEAQVSDLLAMQRASLDADYKAGLRAAGTNDEVAQRILKRYHEEIDKLDEAEVQLGKSMSARKMSVARQYINQFPALQEEFTSTLGFVAKLSELRSESLRTSEAQFKKMDEDRAAAYAKGYTPEMYAMAERGALAVKMSGDALQQMLNVGELTRHSWQPRVEAMVQGSMTHAMASYMPAIKNVASGAGNVSELKAQLLSAKEQEITSLTMFLQGLETEAYTRDGVRLRIDPEEYIKRLNTFYDNMIDKLVNTDDMRNLAEIRRLEANEWASTMAAISMGFGPDPMKGYYFIDDWVKGLNDWADVRTRLAGPTGLGEVQEALEGNNPEAEKILRSLRSAIGLERSKNGFGLAPPVDFNSEEVQWWFAVQNQIVQGGLLDAETARRAAPLIQRFLKQYALSGGVHAEDAARMSMDVADMQMDPDDVEMHRLFNFDAGNPNSASTAVARAMPKIFDEQLTMWWQKKMIPKLEAADPAVLQEISFDSSREDPFYISNQTLANRMRALLILINSKYKQVSNVKGPASESTMAFVNTLSQYLNSRAGAATPDQTQYANKVTRIPKEEMDEFIKQYPSFEEELAKDGG